MRCAFTSATDKYSNGLASTSKLPRRKIVVFAPSYNPNVGGVVWLHKLCHVLNELGESATLFPAFNNVEVRFEGFLRGAALLAYDLLRSVRPYRVNDSFNTPYFGRRQDLTSDDWIVVYPETVLGNPLRARNVARLFLHAPGFITGKAYYGFNEFHIRGGVVSDGFQYPHCQLYPGYLDLTTIPWDIYRADSTDENATEVAYCIRKGVGKPFVHDQSAGVCIDGRSHEEIARIFSRSKVFISYDANTAFSQYAALCGCLSVVVPDEGIAMERWRPDPRDRYGVAYGLENAEEAFRTRPLLKGYLEQKEAAQRVVTADVVEVMNAYFDSPRYSYFADNVKRRRVAGY